MTRFTCVWISCIYVRFWDSLNAKIWSKVSTLTRNRNRKCIEKAKYVGQMWFSLKSFKLCRKKTQKGYKTLLRSPAFGFSQSVRMQDRNGTKLSPLKHVWILSSEQQPFVLLWATSASKIRCKAPLCVTVKGRWERSTTFTARLHCISTVARIVTHYLQAESTNWQPKHPLSNIATLWTEVSVCFVFFLSYFSSFIRKKKLRDRPPWSGSASQSRSVYGLPCFLKLHFPGTWL